MINKNNKSPLENQHDNMQHLNSSIQLEHSVLQIRDIERHPPSELIDTVMESNAVQPLTYWNTARAGKLGFFLFPLVMASAGFTSNTIFRFLAYFLPNFNWLRVTEAIISSGLTAAGLWGTSAYSYVKNRGVYQGDGKSEGNLQLVDKLSRYKDINDTEKESGQDYLQFNASLPVYIAIAGLVYWVFYSVAIIGQQYDNKENNSSLTGWLLWLYGVANLIGLVSAVVIAGTHEIVASNLRAIKLKVNHEINKFEQYKIKQEAENNEKLKQSYEEKLNVFKDKIDELNKKTRN